MCPFKNGSFKNTEMGEKVKKCKKNPENACYKIKMNTFGYADTSNNDSVSIYFSCKHKNS